ESAKFIDLENGTYEFSYANNFTPTKKKPYHVVKADVDGYVGFVGVRGNKHFISVGCFTGTLKDAKYRWSNDPTNAYHIDEVDPENLTYYDPNRVSAYTKRL